MMSQAYVAGLLSKHEQEWSRDFDLQLTRDECSVRSGLRQP